ncbi:hypothetical protein QZL99_14640, partial [Burkholderia multivorans]|nr:hypothetical protein [Burkholderia multivorans]
RDLRGCQRVGARRRDARKHREAERKRSSNARFTAPPHRPAAARRPIFNAVVHRRVTFATMSDFDPRRRSRAPPPNAP